MVKKIEFPITPGGFAMAGHRITKLDKLTKMNKEKNVEVLNVSPAIAKPMLADSAVRDALSALLRVGASLTAGISGEISEWDLPKTTPLKTRRKIAQEADKWNDANRRRAIELKNAYDVLSRHFR